MSAERLPGLREEEEIDPGQPLAARMRPRTLDEIVGQEHILGPGRALRVAIERDRLPSIILWGPPGSGKTTLAGVIANSTRSAYVPLSAVSAGVADLRRSVEDAVKLRRASGRRTILFIDEIHRFNKAQQDAVLPHVEKGAVTLIGATTENPSFEMNAALLSRSRVYVLRSLTEEQLVALLLRALSDPVRGLGALGLRADEDTLRKLALYANGDARVALTALELAADAAVEGQITAELLADALQHRALLYDKGGEQHYDIISALHKSIRDSDADGALYWLGRMLEAGEDPLYIARRLMRAASEDVGLADPQALSVCVAAQQAVHVMGMPEGNLALAQAAVYLVLAPKSNALYAAYGKVREDVQNTRNDPVPLHLRNAVTGLMKGLGYGKGYKYAHDYENAKVDQEHLPESLRGRRYWDP
ncbi:MAG: replication-associated recombination protein A [Chloroflexota bacterium]|nr:replication-associated recombination protein A [Chloroflexota bacterium]